VSKPRKKKEGTEKLTPKIAEVMGMVPGNWLQNTVLWQLYKSKRSEFASCSSHEEAVSRSLIPSELQPSPEEEILNLDF
jgi:hypothetical protein